MTFFNRANVLAAAVTVCTVAQVALCEGDASASAATPPPFLPSPTPKYSATAGGIIGASAVVAALFFLLDCYLVPLAPETAAEGDGYDEASRLLDKAVVDSSDGADSATYMGRRSLPEIAVTAASVNAAEAGVAEVGVVSDMIEAVSALSSAVPRQGASTGAAGRAVGRGKAPSILSDPALSAETFTRSHATHERPGARARGPSRGSRASSDDDTSASRVNGGGASTSGRQAADMGVTDDEEEDRSAASSYSNQRSGLGRLRAAMGGSTNNTVRAGTALAPRPQSSSDEDQDD